MAKLLYGMFTSLDGYTKDGHGEFGWGAPEHEGERGAEAVDGSKTASMERSSAGVCDTIAVKEITAGRVRPLQWSCVLELGEKRCRFQSSWNR
jgi:hypothetical protein